MSDNLPAARLSDRAKALVRLIIDGCPVEEAIKQSGLSRSASYAVLAKTDIKDAILEGVKRRLSVEAARSVEVIADIRDNGTKEDRVRLDAARILVGLAGFVPPVKSRVEDADERLLSEMSQEDLHNVMAKRAAEVDRLEAELAARAAQVNAPNPAEASPEAKPFLD